MVRNIGKKKGPSGEAQHSVITQRKGQEAKLHPTSEKGDSFKIGKVKAGNNPDQSIGQTTVGSVRSGKKPSSKQTQTKHNQNRAFHYSSDD